MRRVAGWRGCAPGAMLYETYQVQTDITAALRFAAGSAAAAFGGDLGALDRLSLRNLKAACEILSRAGLTHRRPEFAIGRVRVGNSEVEVVEEATVRTPFCTLLHFRKEIDTPQPRVLLVAPL